MAVYETFEGGCGIDWCRGALDTMAFARAATEFISLGPDDIVAHMRERCQHIQFFEFTYAFFKARHLPQAIVTVNPDLWSETVVPLHEFNKTADVIVTSWEERTLDKGILCKLALERLPVDCQNSEALLIDNKSSNLDAWKQHGGIGYLYTTDRAFNEDVANGIDGLVTR